MIPAVEGTRPWGSRGKGSPGVSKGPKPPIQLLKLLKNSQREVKRLIFVIYWVPPGPTQEMEFVGPGGEGPSRSPRFLRPCRNYPFATLSSDHYPNGGATSAQQLGGGGGGGGEDYLNSILSM